MGSIFCCKFFFKKDETSQDLEIQNVKTNVEDPIKRKIEFNNITLSNSKNENIEENIEKKDESTTNLNENIEKRNKDNENEEDDIITEDLKLKNLLVNQPTLKEEEIENKLKEDNKKKTENIKIEEKKEEQKDDDDSNNPIFQKEEDKIEKPKTNTLPLSQGIENKINNILNQIDSNEKKTSGPIKIETQFKKVNTQYTEEEKKQREERLKKRLERAKKKRQDEQEDKSKIKKDENIIKKAEEVEKKLTNDNK